MSAALLAVGLLLGGAGLLRALVWLAERDGPDNDW